LDLPRAGFVVGNKIIHPSTQTTLSEFLNTCKSELGLSPDDITKLSKGFHQGLAGADWAIHMANNVEPKGVLKFAQGGLAQGANSSLVYTINKSNDANILTLTLHDKGSIVIMPPYKLAEKDKQCQLSYGVRIAFNIKEGSFIRDGAYAKIDPPLSQETINNLQKEALQNNLTWNKDTIDSALKNCKLNDAPLTKEQKTMIIDQLSLAYTKEFGTDWMQLAFGKELLDDTKKVFENLKGNPSFSQSVFVYDILNDLKLNDTPLNEKQKKAITNDVFQADGNEALAKALDNNSVTAQKTIKSEILETFEKFKGTSEFQTLEKDSSSNPTEVIGAKKKFRFLTFLNK
jgi:dsDNA-binding SOS-regulon protein